MQKTGILLPRSTFYATIGFDMFEGLRSGLKHLGREDIQIVTENIGFGADKRECYAAAEKLLMQENVSVVFAYIGHRTAQLLRPLFMAANRMLIVLDSGSNMPQEWPVSPNIIYHSLHNSLCSWLTAELAGKDGYGKMGMATGFYDGGYLQTYALARGCVSTGSEMVFNHATGYREVDFTMEPLVAHKQNNPDSCVIGLFSGDYSQWFFNSISKHFPENGPAVYASGYTLEETALEAIDFPTVPVKGVVAWSKTIDNPENKAFIEAMEEAGRNATIFSLLGWESASIAIEALNLMQEAKQNGKAAVEQLKNYSFESPRGQISFHDASNHSVSPLFHVSMVKNPNGYCELSVDRTVTDTSEVFNRMSTESLDEATTGWYNSYTCI